MEQFRLPCHQNVVSLPQCVNFDKCGGFLSHRRWSWVSQPDRVCFYDSPGGGWKHSLPSSGGRVVGVFELKVLRQRGSLLCLVFEKGGRTLLVVWNAALSCILRAIHLPFRATCAAPLGEKPPIAPGLFDQSIVESFSGIVAIGCVGGRVLLLDLALGKKWVSVTMATPRPCHFVSTQAESFREALANAVNSHSHLCINLTGKTKNIRLVGERVGGCGTFKGRGI